METLLQILFKTLHYLPVDPEPGSGEDDESNTMQEGVYAEEDESKMDTDFEEYESIMDTSL